MPTEQAELTTEQTELIEKLNCLEFETSQLNRAYQLWRCHVEQGTAPDWMAMAIRVTYDALITFCLDVSTILADVPDASSARRLAQLEAAAPREISDMLEEESTTAYPNLRNTSATRGPGAEPSPELLPPTELSEQPNSQEAQQEEEEEEEEAGVPDEFSARRLAQLEAAPCEISGMLEEESTTGYPNLRNTGAARGPQLLPMTEISEQRQQEEEADILDTFSATHPAQLQAAPCEISGMLEEESIAVCANLRNTGAAREPRAELSPELLAMTGCAGDPGPEMPVVISSPLTGVTISKQPAIQQGQQEGEAGGEPGTMHSLATLANWLQRSSTGILFFFPPGALGRLFRVASVAILIVGCGATGVYLASARRAAPPVQAAAVAIPTGEKAEFKFDPDPVTAPLGSSFVLSAVLSRGSDIASVAAQIDYDANLLKYVGVSKEGGLLAKDGRQVVLAQRDDPLTGVLRISAERSPGDPGISGDGPVFALAFQARKKGDATVSIVPGAHDSQGRRIEMAGSQVSVKVN